MLALKQIEHNRFERLNKPYKIIYTIINKECYFSLMGENFGSDYPEEVIQKIAKKENIFFDTLRYFDISTYQKYGALFPGQYKVDELQYDTKYGRDGLEPIIKNWVKTSLPQDIFALFKEHIGIDLSTIHPKVVTLMHRYQLGGLIIVKDSEDNLLIVHPNGIPITQEKFFDITPLHNDVFWVCHQNGGRWKTIDMQGKTKSKWISSNKFWSEIWN